MPSKSTSWKQADFTRIGKLEIPHMKTKKRNTPRYNSPAGNIAWLNENVEILVEHVKDLEKLTMDLDSIMSSIQWKTQCLEDRIRRLEKDLNE